MKQAMRLVLSWILVISLVLGLLPAVHASGVRWEKTDREITAQMPDRPVQKDESGVYAFDFTITNLDDTERAYTLDADLTVSFDDSMLELAEVSGNAAAFAWNADGGQIKVSLAEADVISDTKTVARLSFRPLESGVTTVSIVTDRLGDQESGNEERLDLVLEVEMPHVHSYKAVVTAPTCTEGGYTTYTCDCGESYIAEETPALGHDWDGSGCTRCDAARENPFVDVPEGSFYYDAVLRAAQEGIAAGLDATHFGPNAACTRAQVVTFLYRTKA